jgi:hypothetical protein
MAQVLTKHTADDTDKNDRENQRKDDARLVAK